MSDITFRSTQTPSEGTTVQSRNDPITIGKDSIEIPYLDYEREYAHPYLVDHFKLGDRWSDEEGGFPAEIQNISNYLSDKIKTGEVPNSITAIKNILKDMEKTNNLTKEERAVVKIEILDHYINFLQANNKTKQNLRRYNSYSNM